MARKKAQRLPSGRWRIQVTQSKEWDEEKQEWKYHRTSLTADTENEVYLLEAEWNMTHTKRKGTANPVLKDAISAYIEKNTGLISETTIRAYKAVRDFAFHDLMNMRIRSITDDIVNAAIKMEYKRPGRQKGSTLSPKTVKNEWGLISTVLSEYKISFDVKLKEWKPPVHELTTPEVLYKTFKDSDIELPVLLAMWLSFSMSEIRGLTKSGSLKGDMIYIDRVMVYVNGEDIIKPLAKNPTRNRGIKLPPYIRNLIDSVDGDTIVPMKPYQIEKRFRKGLEKAGLSHMTFHDLRHVSASTMEMLGIPDKYKQARGGWATPNIMKSTYIQTFNPVRQAFDKVIDDYFEGIIEES